jgi:hypothetical protein
MDGIISHIVIVAKFFDLSPDDEAEVKGIKTTLYLNLASCYLKLENWDSAIRYCNEALGTSYGILFQNVDHDA